MLKPPPPPPDAIELIRNLEVCVGKQGRCRWVGNRACVFTSMDQRGQPYCLLLTNMAYDSAWQDSFGQVGRSVKLDHQAAFCSFWRLQTQEESHSHNLKVHTSRRLHPTTSMWYDGNGYNRHQWTSHRAPIALRCICPFPPFFVSARMTTRNQLAVRATPAPLRVWQQWRAHDGNCEILCVAGHPNGMENALGTVRYRHPIYSGNLTSNEPNFAAAH